MKGSYVVVDLETTGLSPEKDRILEIGAVKVENGKVTDTFWSMVNCHRELSEIVRNLTGITEEMCAKGREEKEALELFLEFAGDMDLIGHNLPFDFGFLKWSFARYGINFERRGIDTLKIARSCLENLPSKKLEALCEYYQIEQKEKHRALDDAKATTKLFLILQEQFAQTKPECFLAFPMECKIKKQSPMTESQKRYLIDLIKYHKIQIDVSMGGLSKSEASRLIDRIILQYGRKKVNNNDEIRYEKKENDCSSNLWNFSHCYDSSDNTERSS